MTLADEVVAFSADYAETRMKRDQSFTVFYDPFNDVYSHCDCGGCADATLDELEEVMNKFTEDLLPPTRAAQTAGTVAAITAVMIATYDHPDLAVVLRAARVKPSLGRFRTMLETKARAFAAAPNATPTLRLICKAILQEHFTA